MRDDPTALGRLTLSRKAVSFRPDRGAAGFTVAVRDLREVSRNRGVMRGLLRNVTPGRDRGAASFRVRTEAQRYDFTPRSGAPEESDLVVRLVEAMQ
ncbi:MAG: hypothetical protein R2724_22500 [Bryobacterales bacterium]